MRFRVQQNLTLMLVGVLLLGVLEANGFQFVN